jgi:outer membrane protein assembly factor BamD
MRSFLFFVVLVLIAVPAVSGLAQAQTNNPPFWEDKDKKSLGDIFGIKKKEPPSEEELYQEALLNFEGKPTWLARHNPEKAEQARGSKYKSWFYFRTNYTKSIELFQKLVYEYPFTRHLADADFYIAEAYFKTKDYEIALQAYQDFLTRHPRHPKAEYAHYQIALCHYERRKKNPLRDQSETMEARQAFQALLISYPETVYRKDAEDYLKKCEELLMEKEVRIGDFYYKKKEYWSASLRYQRAWAEFPKTSKADYALFRAGVCYQKLERKNDALRAFRELKASYPESPHLKEAEQYLKDNDDTEGKAEN